LTRGASQHYYGNHLIELLVELEMELVELPNLSLLSLAAVGLGSLATYLISQWLPASVADLAAKHGRFAGLGEVMSAGAHAAVRQGRTHEALNVVTTAN
jgi:hypothetical protein